MKQFTIAYQCANIYYSVTTNDIAQFHTTFEDLKMAPSLVTKTEVSFDSVSVMQFTDLEREKLVEFRKVVSDILTKEEYKEDSYLIRWLRARKLDIPKAEEMLRASMKWRKENAVDTILTEELPKELSKRFPLAYLGITKEGYAAFLLPAGRNDLKGALDKYGIEACLRLNIMNSEKMEQVMKEDGRKQGQLVTQVVQVMDCEGLRYGQIVAKICREYFTRGQPVMDNNYPEYLHYGMIINAPKIFYLLYNLMKPIMAKETLEKIDIYGPDKEKWLPVIREKFPVERLPPYWGGTLEGVDEYCSGHEIWIHGPEDMKPFMNGLSEVDAKFTKTVIPARGRLIKEINVTKSETVLEWKFKTENHDVGFQILFTSQKTKDRISMKKRRPSEVVIVPYKRVDSQTSLQQGSHTCGFEGIYSLIFDNSFSIMKAKTLLYQIGVVNQDEKLITAS